MSILTCRQLVIGYGGRGILPPVDLVVERGQFWAIVGRNGAGKSTWFRTVLGLMPPVSGAAERATERISYVPQRAAFDDLYPVPAEDVVAMGMDRGWSFLRPRSHRARALDALREVGAQDLAGRLFRSLSGGQKQRVLLARLVASETELALLDEPTAAMDAVAERETIALLDDIRHRFGTTLLVVSHDLSVARAHADRVLYLDRHQGVVMSGSPDELEALPAFRHAFGGALG